MIFKVFISVGYCILDNDVCADYICCPQTKLCVSNEGFENTTYNNVSVIGILELLININSCNDFVNHTKCAVIFSCCSKLVSYYLSKVFVIN